MASCSDALPTRSIRNSSVDTEGTALPVHRLQKDSTWHDFALLASTVRSGTNPHHAGHRVNTLLNTDAFKIGIGASFVVRGLRPWMCPDSDSAVAAKIPAAAFSKENGSNNLTSNRGLRAAFSELRILAHPPLRSHKNIVELLGIAWMENTSLKSMLLESNLIEYWPVLLLEYSSLGSLPDVWGNSGAKSECLQTEVKLKLCLDVSRGLKALHDCDVVHGDLKCENVLVFQEADIYTAKLADFGYSVTQLEKHDGLLGHTPPWNPPEDNNDLNFLGLKAADIYTLGFVIWRIMTNGDHPFMSPAMGHVLDDDSILFLKKQAKFWEIAFETVNAKMMEEDFFGWLQLSSSAKGLFFSTLHNTPLERSLRHVIGILDQFDMFDLKKVRTKALENLCVTSDGNLGVDISKLGKVKVGDILKDSLSSGKSKEIETGGEDDAGSDSDESKPSISIEPSGDITSAGPSSLELPEGPKLNLDYWSGTEEEAVKAMNMIMQRHKDPARHFRHPRNEEESDVFSGPILITTYSKTTPENMREKRLILRKEGALPQVDPSRPCLSEFNFHFSGQEYEPARFGNKANKRFRIEGMSMFDPLCTQIATRIQKEQPGASIEMSSYTLELPDEKVAKGFSGRAELKITTIADPATDFLRLVAKNGGHVEEDKWTGNTPTQVHVLPETEFLSPDLSFAEEYAALAFSLSEQPMKVRQFLVKSWIDAYKLATSSDRIKLARTLFICFFEVEFDREEALKWLLLSAEEGDLIVQPIIYRAFSALGATLPNSVPVNDWLQTGAMRGSPIAMQDLKCLDAEVMRVAKKELSGRLGGVGINMFKDVEILILHLAEEVVRLAALQTLGQYTGTDNPQEDLHWAKEIISEVGFSANARGIQIDDHWSPEWSCKPGEGGKQWEAYSENRMRAFRDTFRIEEDIAYAINVVGDTILHFAAARGLVNFLTFLVETFRPPLTVLNICYETPLLQACRSGHFKPANYLLDQGAALFRSRRGETPLHWLFMIDNEEERDILAKRLISKELSPSRPAFSPTELHLASGREPQIGTVTSLSSALIWAIERGSLPTLKSLLSDESLDEDDLEFAIRQAAKCWESGCLQLLAKTYADRVQQELDTTFLYSCISLAVTTIKFEGLIYPLLRHGENWIKAFGDTRQCLQDLGAEPQSSKSHAMSEGGTILETAGMCAPPEIVADLLESGWNKELDVPGFQQQVPIALAAIQGRRDIFALMLRFEDKETLPEKMLPLRDGMNVYHWLAEGKSDGLPLAKQLLSLNVAYFENELRSPFEVAVRNGDFEIADFFLQQCGADIERRKNYGDSVTIIQNTMETRWVQPTLLGCLVLENAVYLLPSVKYLAKRGASYMVDPSLELNVFHAWAMGGASDDDCEATELFFTELSLLYPESYHFLRLENARVSTPLGWAIRVRNSVAVRLIVKSSGLSVENLAFEAVGKMGWWDTKTLMSIPNTPSATLESLQNSAALLRQTGFISEKDAKCENESDFWESWLEKASLSQDEDVKKLEIQVERWVRFSSLPAEPTSKPEKSKLSVRLKGFVERKLRK